MSNLAVVEAPAELKDGVLSCAEWSRQNSISTVEDYAETAEHLKVGKSLQKQITDFFGPLKKQASDLHKSIVAKESEALAPLREAETLDKQKMIEWDQIQRQKAEAERKRLQAIADEKARKEREAAQLAAKKQREIEAEAKRKADESRKAAEAATEADRKKLLAAAAKHEQKAATAAEKAEAKVEQAAQVTAPTIAVQAQTQKVAGISARQIWKATIVDRNALLEFLCANKKFEYIVVNETMIQAFAKAQGSNASMPGVKFEQVASIASKGA